MEGRRLQVDELEGKSGIASLIYMYTMMGLIFQPYNFFHDASSNYDSQKITCAKFEINRTTPHRIWKFEILAIQCYCDYTVKCRWFGLSIKYNDVKEEIIIQF